MIGIAAAVWVVRAAMGWHTGRALYWLNEPRSDDALDEEVEDDTDDGSGAVR